MPAQVARRDPTGAAGSRRNHMGEAVRRVGPRVAWTRARVGRWLELRGRATPVVDTGAAFSDLTKRDSPEEEFANRHALSELAHEHKELKRERWLHRIARLLGR